MVEITAVPEQVTELHVWILVQRNGHERIIRGHVRHGDAAYPDQPLMSYRRDRAADMGWEAQRQVRKASRRHPGARAELRAYRVAP